MFFILSNTIFGIGRANVVVPISWAVDVELMMYFASVVFIARNPKFSLYSMLFTTALFPLLWLISKQYIADDPQTASNLIYSFLPAALLPYTIGSFLCHYRKKIILQYSPARLAMVSSGAFAYHFSNAEIFRDPHFLGLFAFACLYYSHVVSSKKEIPSIHFWEI